MFIVVYNKCAGIPGKLDNPPPEFYIFTALSFPLLSAGGGQMKFSPIHSFRLQHPDQDTARKQKPTEVTSMNKEDLLSNFDILRTAYIKLLNDKDVLLAWGKPQLEALYSTRIGVYQLEQLQLELRIKALKRKIEMVRSIIVRNLPLDAAAIELQVAAELAAAELEVMRAVAQIENGKALLSHLDTPQRSAELRSIFKQLAKLLHPDVNPLLTGEQQELWHKAKDAYEHGDLEKLKALRVIYEKEISNTESLLTELTGEQLELRNQVLSEGIKQLEKEIATICNSFPFDLEENIKDEAWVAAKQEAIRQTINQLRSLEGGLILEYEALIRGYGGSKPELN